MIVFVLRVVKYEAVFRKGVTYSTGSGPVAAAVCVSERVRGVLGMEAQRRSSHCQRGCLEKREGLSYCGKMSYIVGLQRKVYFGSQFSRWSLGHCIWAYTKAAHNGGARRRKSKLKGGVGS